LVKQLISKDFLYKGKTKKEKEGYDRLRLFGWGVGKRGKGEKLIDGLIKRGKKKSACPFSLLSPKQL